MPTVSVITPLLNRAAMLPEALASVAAQELPVEHIVVDGGSTDGAPDIARAAGARVFDLPGSSIYEALNFGIAQATAPILLLLNSDDRLAPQAVQAALEKFSNDPQLEIVRGRVRTEDIEGTHSAEEKQALPLTLQNTLLRASNINACAFTKALFERVGPFEPRYKISADRHWMARVLIAGANGAELQNLIYIYREHAGSLTIGRGKSATKQWVEEHLDWSRALLNGQALSGVDKAALRRFHAKETAHLAALHLNDGRLGASLRSISDSFRHDAAWPLRAIAPIGAIIARRAGGR